MLKYILLVIALGICLVVGASYYSMSTPNSTEKKQAEFMRKIPIPSYMTADFSRIEEGCDWKCSNPIKISYSYSSSTSYTKAMQDFSAALKSIGYKQGQSEVDIGHGLSDYEFINADTENHCTQVLVHQYHELNEIEANCYLHMINVTYGRSR
jgi:hypothetical protein